jgi:hypothetical protein
VTADRRQVRVTEAFFDQLDELLPSHRGPRGEPSATDFIVIDLPPIVDQIAVGFDGLPEIVEGVPSARMVLGAGRLVARFVVFAVAVDDDSVDVIGVDLDIEA